MCSHVDRLLQGQFPRHRLIKESSQPAETAFSAFNLPKDAAHQSTSGSHNVPADGEGMAPHQAGWTVSKAFACFWLDWEIGAR